MAIELPGQNLSLLSPENKKKFKLEVTMIVEVEVDLTNEIVKEYGIFDELLSDIVSYRFSQTLPVMQSGVKANFEESTYEVLEGRVGRIINT